MTPKEKALELVDKFIYYVLDKDFFGDNVDLKNAKKCALIAVDEVLKTIGDKIFSEYKYWQEVKQEILAV